MFSQICQCFKYCFDDCCSLAAVFLNSEVDKVPTLAFMEIFVYTLLQQCSSFLDRIAPKQREMHPLTPACHEIIGPCSVPDCMLVPIM